MVVKLIKNLSYLRAKHSLASAKMSRESVEVRGFL